MAGTGWGKRSVLVLLVRVITFLIVERLTNTLNPGDIYLGINTISGEEIGIKLESVKAKHLQLQHASKVYKLLAGASVV